MTKKPPRRYPNEQDKEFGRLMLAELQDIIRTSDDQYMTATYGPEALRDMDISWAGGVASTHLSAFKTRAGDVLEVLKEPLSLAKGTNLPLFAPCLIRIAPGSNLRARTQENVWTMECVVLDYDKGDAPFKKVIARLEALEIAGMVYRSPSDGTTQLKILRCSGELTPGVKELCAPTKEAVSAWLSKEGYKAENIEPFEIIDEALVEISLRSIENVKTGKWEQKERN